MWYKLICPFEGPTDEGTSLDLYVEWDENLEEIELWNHILSNEEKIQDFYEHSIDEELTVPLTDTENEEIKKNVREDMAKPNYALFRNGEVYKMDVIGKGKWIK